MFWLLRNFAARRTKAASETAEPIEGSVVKIRQYIQAKQTYQPSPQRALPVSRTAHKEAVAPPAGWQSLGSDTVP